MDLNKLKEEDFFNLGQVFHLMARDGFYYIDSNRLCPADYDVFSFTNLLSKEEQKFLIAESVLNYPEQKELVWNLFSFSNTSEFIDSIRAMNQDELNKFISVLKHTEGFNGYLCYMLSDWEENFDSVEERKSYTY